MVLSSIALAREYASCSTCSLAIARLVLLAERCEAHPASTVISVVMIRPMLTGSSVTVRHRRFVRVEKPRHRPPQETESTPDYGADGVGVRRVRQKHTHKVCSCPTS